MALVSRHPLYPEIKQGKSSSVWNTAPAAAPPFVAIHNSGGDDDGDDDDLD